MTDSYRGSVPSPGSNTPSVPWTDRLRRSRPLRWWRMKPLVCDLIDAALASEPEMVGNDFGNAVEALRRAVER